jgi:hypothetical protein
MNVVVFGLLCLFDGPQLLKMIVCYNIFTIMGYLYYKRITYRMIVLMFIFSVVLLLGALWIFNIQMIPMQSHKFPPDVVFLLYNTAVLCLLSLIFSKVRLRSNWLLELWNDRGYTIYLYQNLVIFVLFLIKENLFYLIPSLNLQLIICLVFTLSISTALSYLTYPLERKVMKLMHM